jgi:hypothetical protein
MTACRHGREVDRLFAGRLRRGAHRRLRAHLRDCASCRARHDALMRLERVATCADPTAAATAVETPSHFEVERGLDLVLDAARPRAWHRTGIWAGALVASAAAVALVLSLTARTGVAPAPERHTFRGDGVASEAAVELTVLCVQGDARPPVRELSPGGACPRAAVLSFAWSSHLAHEMFVVAVAIDAAGATHPLVPGRDAHTPARLMPGAVEARIGDSLVLSSSVAPGALRIVALVAPTAVALAGVEATRLASRPVAPPVRAIEARVHVE